MDTGSANATATASDLRAAGEVLRPALVLWLVVQLLHGAMALGYTHAMAVDGQPPEQFLAIASVVGVVGDVVCAAVILWFVRRDRQAARIFVRSRRGAVELCLLAGIVGAMLLAWWEARIPTWAASVIETEHSLGWPIWLSLVTSAVMPAVFEELMFRGVIQQSLQRVVGLRLAIAVQAMLFSTMHLDSFYALPHFAFGCLAGFLRTVAGALWPCMLLHFGWNGWIVLATYGWI
jgi:membrane protease YdiL (CAAX protease family)